MKTHRVFSLAVHKAIPLRFNLGVLYVYELHIDVEADSKKTVPSSAYGSLHLKLTKKSHDTLAQWATDFDTPPPNEPEMYPEVVKFRIGRTLIRLYDIMPRYFAEDNKIGFDLGADYLVETLLPKAKKRLR